MVWSCLTHSVPIIPATTSGSPALSLALCSLASRTLWQQSPSLDLGCPWSTLLRRRLSSLLKVHLTLFFPCPLSFLCTCSSLYTCSHAPLHFSGLQREDAVIHFPFLIHTLCYLLGALPGNVRMVIWQILYFFKKRGRKEGKSE